MSSEDEKEEIARLAATTVLANLGGAVGYFMRLGGDAAATYRMEQERRHAEWARAQVLSKATHLNRALQRVALPRDLDREYKAWIAASRRLPL